MKRVKRISAKGSNGSVEITVRVDSDGWLGRSEVDDVVTDLADSAMLAINGTRFFKVPLSKIVVD